MAPPQSAQTPRKWTCTSATANPSRGTRRESEVGDVDDRVADAAAARADHVVVGVLDVGVDAHAAGADVEQVDLAEVLELVDGLIDGLQRDRRHLGAGGVVERFDRRVLDVAVEQPEDHLALRGHPQAVVPEPGGELVDGGHADDVINNDCRLLTPA